MSARVWLVLVLVVAAVLGGVGIAHAQQGQGQRPGDFRRVERGQPRTTAAARAEADPDAKAAKAEDPEQAKRKLKSSRWLALVFWAFALMIVGGSIFVLTRRNLIAAVMGMVGTFFAIAAVYAMLFAHFLAVIQVLVYAGAIMVLFVFVIMILNKPEDQIGSRQAWPGKALAIGAAMYLLLRMGSVLWEAKPNDPERGKPPGELVIRQVAGDEAPTTAPFGSTKAVGKTLFQDYLFPFEAISLVLLVAVVGALAVARPHHEKHDGGAA